MSKKRSKRYGGWSSAYGALGFLIAVGLSQAGYLPKSEIPLIAEGVGTVAGGFAGICHAWFTDKDES